MKYYVLILLTLLVCSISPILAQRSISRTIEAGIMFGATNYSGDVAEKAVELSETNAGYGFFIRYHFNKNFSFKTHIYSGSISGDDKNTQNASRKFRFGTSIFEAAAVGEWILFSKDRLTNTGIFRPRIEPYLFGGIGLTLADAKAEYYGSTANIDLRVPLPEDGLKKRFLLVPVGIGLRATMSERFILGIEGGLRPVFSDDLDGMKTNGNPDNNDWYYFAGLTMSILIGGRDY